MSLGRIVRAGGRVGGVEYRWTDEGDVRWPWSAERPLVFHVLGGVRVSVDELLERNATLTPATWRISPTKTRGFVGRDSMFQPEDHEAGDTSYVFLTPFTAFDGKPGIARTVFAFDAQALLQRRQAGLRPCDLLMAFQDVRKLNLPTLARQRALRAIVEVGTEFRQRVIRPVLRAQARVALGGDEVVRQVDRTALARFAAEKLRELEAARLDEIHPELPQIAAHRISWATLNRSFAAVRSTSVQPEFIYPGALPLRAAVMYRTAGSSEWVELPQGGGRLGSF